MCRFRHPLGVLEHISADKGGPLSKLLGGKDTIWFPTDPQCLHTAGSRQTQKEPCPSDESLSFGFSLLQTDNKKHISIKALR